MSSSSLSPLIICFGDSLTVGYQSPTPDDPSGRETPYGTALQEMLGARARVSISGICGEVTGEMVMRFRQDVLNHAPSYVIILGGTNDLGWMADPAEIMRNLLKMYESAQAVAIEAVAVTVPSVRLSGDLGGGKDRRLLQEHITRRLALNGLISDYCASKSRACIDLFNATAEPNTLFLASPYSNDGLHLTSEGYRCLATLLYKEVFAPRLGRTGHFSAES